MRFTNTARRIPSPKARHERRIKHSDTSQWWRGGVIYQIYPRSFQDSNGDGIGDLRGITQRLQYVADLGVEAIWISPFFASPMKDFGYDISDYRAVDPIFGSLADFDALVSKAHSLGLKVIIDQVFSHTSDQHPWFVESCSSRTNRRADWYVWADPKPDGNPPNNWLSVFGGSAWQWHTTRRQYYFHNFLTQQPDLNLHCAAVQKEILDTMEFWLRRGVDGFRLDALNHYFHDKKLRNNPSRKGGPTRSVHHTNPYALQRHVYDKNRPENAGFLRDVRRLFDRYGAISLGEIGDEYPEVIIDQYTKGGDKLHMAYSFNLLTSEYSARHIREQVEHLYKTAKEAWGCWSVGNHDAARVLTRWGSVAGVSSRSAAHAFSRLVCAIVASLRGSVCWYQGDELALPEADVPFERIQDPVGKNFWPENKGRDGCRTPIPWEGGKANAGFSRGATVETWLPVPKEHASRAVNRAERDADSPLHTVRRFLQWRKGIPALRTGSIEFLDTPEPVLALIRKPESRQGAGVLCIFNLSGRSKRVSIGSLEVRALSGHGFPGKQVGMQRGRTVSLPPFGVFFAEV